MQSYSTENYRIVSSSCYYSCDRERGGICYYTTSQLRWGILWIGVTIVYVAAPATYR